MEICTNKILCRNMCHPLGNPYYKDVSVTTRKRNYFCKKVNRTMLELEKYYLTLSEECICYELTFN